MKYEKAAEIIEDNNNLIKELEELEEKQAEIKKNISYLKRKIKSRHLSFINAKKYFLNRKKYIEHLESIHPDIKYVSGYKMGRNNHKSGFRVLVEDKKTMSVISYF